MKSQAPLFRDRQVKADVADRCAVKNGADADRGGKKQKHRVARKENRADTEDRNQKCDDSRIRGKPACGFQTETEQNTSHHAVGHRRRKKTYKPFKRAGETDQNEHGGHGDIGSNHLGIRQRRAERNQ